MPLPGRSERLSKHLDSVKVGGLVIPRRVAYVIESEDGSPAARIVWEASTEGRKCTEVTITAAADGRSIRDGDLMFPTLDRLGESIFFELAQQQGVRVEDYKPGSWHDETDPDRYAAEFERRNRQDIRTHGDVELRKAAEVYRQAVADGFPPREAVAAQLGLTLVTASRRIQAARKKGYLPPTTQGKANA